MMSKEPIFTIHKANSIELIQKSDDNKCSGVEVDLRMTKDGVVVVHHDRRFKDGNSRNCWIDKFSFSELMKSTNEPILTFEDMLDVLIKIGKRKPGYILDLDIKQFNIHRQVFEILKKKNALSVFDEIIISSPDAWTLQAFDNLDPRFSIGLTLGPNDKWDLYDIKLLRYFAVVVQYTLQPLVFKLFSRKSKHKQIQYANLYHRMVDEKTSAFLHDQKIKILAYGITKQKHIDALKPYNVAGIKVDKALL